MTVVIDTNVVLVANGQHGEVSPDCVATCALRLQATMHRGRIALDGAYLILAEYQRKTRHVGGRRPGDAFVKWALQNNANPRRCDLVKLEVDAAKGFQTFPDDSRLSSFDPSDRKFVATSRAHPLQPPILQAADSKWIDWAAALHENGVFVEFICRSDVERFREQRVR